jgi:hypothetical protein
MLELIPPNISEIRPAPEADLPANVFTPEPKATPNSGPPKANAPK